MYSIKSGLILGFHGCDKQVRDSIVNQQTTFKASDNVYDWLGGGMYFWENNVDRAMEFACEQHMNPSPNRAKIKVPVVLGVVMNLGRCLDLLDSRYLAIVEDSYKNLADSYSMLGTQMPINANTKNSSDMVLRKLDCAVIENVHRKSAVKFDSVRGVFIEGDKLYQGAGFNKKNHIQICVRNPNCIKGYFIPRDLAQGWDNV